MESCLYSKLFWFIVVKMLILVIILYFYLPKLVSLADERIFLATERILAKVCVRAVR